MRTASEVATLLQLLLALREKAERCMSPAPDAEGFQADRTFFEAVAKATTEAPWAEVANANSALLRLIVDPMPAQGRQGLLNAFWYGDGALSLAWLIGALPSLAPETESVSVLAALESIPRLDGDLDLARVFIDKATLKVTAEVAQPVADAFDAAVEKLSPKLKRAKDEAKAKELSMQRSRALERGRFLAWALSS
ncbi:MAG: hypothetical protein QM817_22285 [Archangium sp.]